MASGSSNVGRLSTALEIMSRLSCVGIITGIYLARYEMTARVVSLYFDRKTREICPSFSIEGKSAIGKSRKMEIASLNSSRFACRLAEYLDGVARESPCFQTFTLAAAVMRCKCLYQRS